MRKKILTLGLTAIMTASLVACGGSSGDSDSGNASDQDQAEEVTYESILDDYTKQLQDATPGLVEEYNEESADLSGDVNALAELSNEKIEELAEICNDGVGEMAELKLKNGDDDETYEDWAGKLQDIYQDEAQDITDAYMDSATN